MRGWEKKKEIRNTRAHDNSVATSYGRNGSTEGRTEGIALKLHLSKIMRRKEDKEGEMAGCKIQSLDIHL